MSSDTQSPIPAEFGANEWLVEEMYDQYVKDPTSVDPAWAAFFTTNGAPHGANGSGSAPSNGAAPAASAVVEPAPAPVAATPAPAPGTPATAPEAVSAPATTPVPKEAPAPVAASATDEPSYTILRGAPARTVINMDASLTVPTATSGAPFRSSCCGTPVPRSTPTSPALAAARCRSPT